MDFEEFLSEHIGMTEAAFNELPQEAKAAIQTSFYLSARNAAELKQRQAENAEKADEEQREQARADEYAKWEQRRQQKQAWYDQWDGHFRNYAREPSSIVYQSTRRFLTERQDELTRERNRQSLAITRRQFKNDPEKLLFAEADTLEANLKLESWERCVPLGNHFDEMLDYAKSQRKNGEKLSDAMKQVNPDSIDCNMYSHLLTRYDGKDVSGLEPEQTIRDIYKNDPDSLKFYQQHRSDHKCFANPENLKFTLEEMFRLGDRMSRNSRMSQPMKELCGKLNALKKDYRKNPKKYNEMPLGRLNHLMQSITFAADAYINDKKNLKSFSSTQLERLKCINQMKSLQEALPFNASKKEYCFGNEGQYMDGFYSYSENALAEKLVLNHQIQSKDGAALCDREKMQDLVQDVLESNSFKKFKEMTISTVRKSQGEKYPIEAIHDKLLKSNGQELLEKYQAFNKKLFREEHDALFASHNEPAAPAANIPQNNAPQNKGPAAPAKKTDGMGGINMK